MVAVGRVLRFDETRGYGFIAPAAGGDDVFVHANDFGEAKFRVRPGLRVEYECTEGDRGLKVASVRILDESAAAERPLRAVESGPDGVDDGMCDVLARSEFTAEITEMLLRHAPSLSGAQICEIRDRLAVIARDHGWIEA
ncbi:cold-shock protein [Dactylosporangium sp. CA-152071]|uniref:cold-shock protein n=1 Tax=Dactylosporangium sp. CA-152071 TaxID=3239933 RepID=UPI003D929521